MSTVIAGYFDSEDDATRAMDILLKDPQMRDVESEVISNPASGAGNAGNTGVIPIVPNTTTGLGSGTGSGVGPIAVTGGAGHHLFDELDEEEAVYFQSAMGSGEGVLALIKVDKDEHAMHVRRVFSQNGARTYME